jgi:chromosome segregation ATPase
MFGIKKLKEDIGSMQEEINSLKLKIYETNEAHSRLLAHLKLYEITERATPEKKKFLTDEEYAEWSKNQTTKMNNDLRHYYSSPASYHPTSMWDIFGGH